MKTPYRTPWLLPLAAIQALWLGGCSAQESAPLGPRLVVLYSTCTLSKDFLSPYDSSIGFTPNLQRFADESVVFERHNTEAGQSGVAFASIYSGQHADVHQVYQHPSPLAEEPLMITEAFGLSGYRPYFWSGHSMASQTLGYGQGVAPEDVHETHITFTKTAKHVPEGFFSATTANGPEFQALLANLQADPSSRAFVQINFTITHELYHEYANLDKIMAFEAAHPECASGLSRAALVATLTDFEENRHGLQFDFPNRIQALGWDAERVERLDRVMRLAYSACVAQLDGYFGQFIDSIDAAGLKEDSLVVLTADHGDTFFHESEFFHWTHGLQLAPSVIEVPLIMRASASGLEPRRYAGVSSSVDVYPTMIELAGLTLPESVKLFGVSLAAAARGQVPEPDQLSYSHTSTLGPARIRRYKKENYQWVTQVLPEADPKYIWTRVRQGDLIWEWRHVPAVGMQMAAFDLAQDPYRARNIFAPADPLHRERAEQVQAYHRRLGAHYTETSPLDQKVILNTLAGLGYIDGEEEED